MEPIDVEVLFNISRSIDSRFGTLRIGKYAIESIPRSPGDMMRSNIPYMLRFQDSIRKGERSSNPLKEAELFLSFLSLLTRSKLEIYSSMMNSIPAEMPELKPYDPYREYDLPLKSLPDFNLYLGRLGSLDCETARQFLRSCDVYKTALNLIGENNTLSFFLLCIAIECISNKISEKEGTCEKFIDFIVTYLPNKRDFDTVEDWREILKEIYYRHRSGFTHGGKQIPEASLLADKLNRKYVRNQIDGKVVRTPGLKWFETVVRNSLMGFLEKTELIQEDDQTDYFKEISLEYGKMRLRFKRTMDAGRFVTSEDVNLD